MILLRNQDYSFVYDMIGNDMIWYDMIWYDMMWCDMKRDNLILR